MGTSLGLAEGEITFESCDLHTTHVPKTDLRDIALNRVVRVGDEEIVVCPAGLARLKAAIMITEAHEGIPTWGLMQFFGKEERRLAEKAWRTR